MNNQLLYCCNKVVHSHSNYKEWPPKIDQFPMNKLWITDVKCIYLYVYTENHVYSINRSAQFARTNLYKNRRLHEVNMPWHDLEWGSRMSSSHSQAWFACLQPQTNKKETLHKEWMNADFAKWCHLWTLRHTPYFIFPARLYWLSLHE